MGTFRTVRLWYVFAYVNTFSRMLCLAWIQKTMSQLFRLMLRMPSRIKIISELSHFSKYICKGEKALFSRTKWKFTVLHNVICCQNSIFGTSFEKSSLSLLQVLESHLSHLRREKCLCWFSCDSRFLIWWYLRRPCGSIGPLFWDLTQKNRSQWRNMRAWN